MKKADLVGKVSTQNWTLVRKLLEEGGVHCEQYWCRRRPENRMYCVYCCRKARAIIRVLRSHVL